MHGQRRRQLRHRRDVRRRRRLPAVRDGHRVRGGVVHRLDLHAGAHVQRHRHLPDDVAVDLRSLRVRHRRRLPHDVLDVRRVHQPQHLPGGELRQEADRRRCAAAAECNSDLCEQGVCCATACAGICRSCALAGHRRHLRVDRAPATDPLQPVRRPGRVDLRHRRHLRRQRRLPPLRQRDHLRRVDLQRNDVHARAHLRRRRRLRHRLPPPTAAPYVCGAGGTCLATCDGRRRLRGAQRLHRRKLRQAAQRRGVHGGGRVRERLLRARHLLPDGLHRELPLVRDARHGGHLHAGRGRRRSARASAPTAAPRPAAPTASATAAAPAGCTPAGRSASPRAAAGRRSRPRAPATAPAPVRRRRRRRAAPTPARPACAGRRARPTPTARRPTSA